MYLDRCVLCCESDWDDYFELHEITTKDTYILKVSFREIIAHNSYNIFHTFCSEVIRVNIRV